MTLGKKFSIAKFIIYVFLIIWAVTTIFPFLWVIVNSFKGSSEIMTSSFALPSSPSWDNYTNAFSKQNILNSYKNSLIISGCVTVAVMILSSMIAFAMTRYQFKGKNIINMILVGSLMFPVFATIIPIFRMVAMTGLINKRISVILPQVAGNLSFATIVMMGFMRGLPIEMEEAAYMEGAGVYHVFTRIIVPLCKASLSTVAIFCFLWSYNDLFTQTVMMRVKEMYPICKLLSEISSQYGTDYGLLCSSVALIILPVLVVYIFLQKNIIKGLTAGAVKG